MTTWQAWESRAKQRITFSTKEKIAGMASRDLLESDAKMLHEFALDGDGTSDEEWVKAMTLHHEKMGWEPYKPME